MQLQCKAHIPPECEPFYVGASHWFSPQCKTFALGIPIRWYLKTLAYPMQIQNFTLLPRVAHSAGTLFPTQPATQAVTRAPTQTGGIYFVLGTCTLASLWACQFHVVCFLSLPALLPNTSVGSVQFQKWHVAYNYVTMKFSPLIVSLSPHVACRI